MIFGRKTPKDPRPQKVRVQEIVDEAVKTGVILAGGCQPTRPTITRPEDRPRWNLTYSNGQEDTMSQHAVAPRLRGVYMAAHLPCPDNVKREMKRSWE